MMRWLWLLLALLIAAAPAAAATRDEAPFRRGASVHNMLNWATVTADGVHYAWPPFQGAQRDVPDVLINHLYEAGFDFIRLTVDPGPFLQFKGRQRDELDRILVVAVRRFLAHGLAVIVDFHANEHVPAYAPIKLVQGIDDPLFRDYVAMIGRTARVLAGLGPPKVGIEPMNEPPYGYDPSTTRRWQAMLETLHRAIRSAARDLTIVLTGAHGGDRDGLIALDPAPFAGSKVLYSIHYYEPHDFTHQGVETSEPAARHWRFLSGLPYPSNSIPREEAWRRIEDNILLADLSAGERRLALSETKRKVLAYLDAGYDRARVVRDFDAVGAWARRNGIAPQSILLGEFGVVRTYGSYRGADTASRVAWLGDVRTEAERRSFGWAIWDVKDSGGMAIVESDDSTTLDHDTLRALGLKFHE
jgi:endoglucanase